MHKKCQGYKAIRGMIITEEQIININKNKE